MLPLSMNSCTLQRLQLSILMSESPTGDDEGEEPWIEPIEPTKPPVPYTPKEDDVLEEEKEVSDWSTPNESIQQMERNQNVLIGMRRL